MVQFYLLKLHMLHKIIILLGKVKLKRSNCKNKRQDKSLNSFFFLNQLVVFIKLTRSIFCKNASANASGRKPAEIC